jgi:hypothetical protein
VPFSVLRQDPLNLVYNDLVQAQILAVNEIGIGPWNEANIVGVLIQTEPQQPDQSIEILEYGEYEV